MVAGDPQNGQLLERIAQSNEQIVKSNAEMNSRERERRPGMAAAARAGSGSGTRTLRGSCPGGPASSRLLQEAARARQGPDFRPVLSPTTDVSLETVAFCNYFPSLICRQPCIAGPPFARIMERAAARYYTSREMNKMAKPTFTIERTSLGTTPSAP